MGAFRNVDASKNNLTIHYPNSWGNDNLQKLKDEIKESGMTGKPNYSADSPTVTPSLLDAARLFGL
ncbi:hypothetical protein B5G12_05145 [Faecalibacterium sp. An58]|uniref:hypothetical protein n=1 Tax=Faecalibacterium sp. An58 TaxID=1965648 RepID=UPI000B565850|nr:hypothetical protein [Faecalibacterium sp. An58]OUN74527.1 hypothetical protein B5G12_05145 [Faecalibacterium sp. An58]